MASFYFDNLILIDFYVFSTSESKKKCLFMHVFRIFDTNLFIFTKKEGKMPSFRLLSCLL